MVELAERLIGKGFDVKIHDATWLCHGWSARTAPTSTQRLPHIGDLLIDDVDEVLAHGEVLIAGSARARGRRRDHRERADTSSSSTWCGCRTPSSCAANRNYRGIGW